MIPVRRRHGAIGGSFPARPEGRARAEPPNTKCHSNPRSLMFASDELLQGVRRCCHLQTTPHLDTSTAWPTPSGLPTRDDPKAAMRRWTSEARHRQRPSTRDDHPRRVHGPCFSTENPRSTLSTSRWRRRCCHLRRTPSGRLQATLRVARFGACALNLRGERAWERSMSLGSSRSPYGGP